MTREPPLSPPDDGKPAHPAAPTKIPSPAVSRGGPIIPWLLPLAILGLGFALFHFWGITYSGLDVRDTTRSAFVWLMRRWRDSSLCFGSDYSHGWLVVPVSTWLVWRRRAELRAAPRRTTPAALAPVILGLLAHWLGMRAEIPHLSVLGMLSLLWSIPFYLRGWPTARVLLFPCAYLLLSVPWNFFESVTFPLRLLMASTSSFLLNGLGIPATCSGTAIYSTAGEGFNFDVADPCSGIRSLVAMMALVTAYAYVTQRSWLRRGILFAASIPLAIAGNISRILIIAMAALEFGTRVAMGIYHDYSGYIVFATAILLLLGLQALLNRWLPEKADTRPPPAEPPAAAGPRGVAPWPPQALILALMAATVAALVFAPAITVSPQTSVRMELPPKVGGWTGVELLFCHQPQCLKDFQADKLTGTGVCPACGGKLFARSLAETQILPPDTVIVRRCYTLPGQDPISVTLVGSGRERASLHRPEVCLVAQGGTIRQSRAIPIPLPGRPALKVTALDLVRQWTIPDGRRLEQGTFYVYWFVGKNRETPSHFQRMIWMGVDRILRNAAYQWVFLAVATPQRQGGGESTRRVTEFLQTFYPLMTPDNPAPQTEGHRPQGM